MKEGEKRRSEERHEEKKGRGVKKPKNKNGGTEQGEEGRR